MTRYRANTPRLVDETLDGEALIIDMVSGMYYSCTGASALAWDALKNGLGAEEVTGLLSSTYAVPSRDVAPDVERFVDELLREEMLVERNGDETTRDGAIADQVVPRAGEDGYQRLQLDKHADLADLLLLDPVHDVTDAGWPNRKR